MRHIRYTLPFLITGMFMLALYMPVTATGQLVASEFSTLTQTVDGTDISIAYYRPSRRDRDPLFGGVMKYGDIITPGANMATTLEFSKDVKINGTAVSAGKYSVWIAFEEGSWEFLLDETWERFHGPHPVRSELEYGFMVTPTEVALVNETLTFDFPSVHEGGTTLRMHWGTTMIELDIEIEPTPLVNITATEAKRYVGTYDVNVAMIPPYTMFEGKRTYEFTYENGFLHAIMDIGPYTDPHDMAFYPQSENVLFPVILIEGVPAHSFEGGLFYEFTQDEAGNITGFEGRMPNDVVWMTGKRQ